MQDTATANVTGRLCNAQLVKSALATTIQGVRQALGLDVTAPAGKQSKKEAFPVHPVEEGEKEEEWKGFSDDLAVGNDEGEATDDESENLQTTRARNAESLKQPAEDDGENRDDVASQSDNDDFAAYDARLASSDEDESDLDSSRDSSAAQLKRELAQAVASVGEESSDTATFEQGQSDTSMTSAERPVKSVDVAKRMIHAHLGISLPRVESNSITPERPLHPLAHSKSHLPDFPANAKSAVDKETDLHTNATIPMDSDSDSSDQLPSPKLRPTSNTFLPSLSMGGYWSGSEGDEPEDIEELVAPRKNRRGQRARQAIAEAKFGAAAKHVVEGRPANKPKDARDAGWDMKRGATNAEDMRGYKGMGRKERRSRMEGARKAGASGGNAIPIASGKSAASGGDAVTFEKSAATKPKRDDIGSLHPSWEAKRKAKAATGKIVPFQGTKITFD